MTACYRLPLMILTTLVATVAAGQASDVRTQARDTPDGASLAEFRLPNEPRPAPAPDQEAVATGTKAGTILWQRELTDAIYTSVGISAPAEIVFAGTYLNAPMHVEATPVSSLGTPSWTYDGTRFLVDASRDGDVLAAVDFAEADSVATIMQWAPGSSTPLWSYVVYPCRSLIYQGWAARKPICVSDDGSTIALGITMYGPSALQGRLYIFQAGNGTPVTIYDLPSGSISAVEVTTHGEYVALASWPTVYVYDRDGQALRWSGPIGAGNDALAISGDGRYLAWGWTTFYLREWTGSSYAPLWSTTPGGGLYVGQCALSPDGGRLAVSWDNGNQTPNVVFLELYELPSLGFLWRYDYPPSLRNPLAGFDSRDTGSSRDHVDIPTQMRFSPDGERLAVASWGGSFPEIHVFDCSHPDPIFTLDTPGSMFDIDIVGAPPGSTYIAAGGKHVHAGQSGRGGDLYAVAIPSSATAAPEQAATTHSFALGPGQPNPFRSGTTISYELPTAALVHLTVHDVRGRLVATLVDRFERPGLHSARWTGRSDGGTQMPAGVYLARLKSGDAVRTGKVLLLR